VNDAVPYEHLTPDLILDSVESCGFACTGSILALASYENRVYQLGTDDGFARAAACTSATAIGSPSTSGAAGVGPSSARARIGSGLGGFSAGCTPSAV
jgi:hypothetical protein